MIDAGDIGMGLTVKDLKINNFIPSAESDCGLEKGALGAGGDGGSGGGGSSDDDDKPSDDGGSGSGDSGDDDDKPGSGSGDGDDDDSGAYASLSSSVATLAVTTFVGVAVAAL